MNSSENRAGDGCPPAPVEVRLEDVIFPTYLPAWPDRNPMFLERRVYQGSSGRVYPLPFTDRIAEQPVDRKWRGIWLENAFLRVLVLPELGGRIHVLQDKTNGYDLIYRQPVIKPALVGLAGPWISGGIEFNWPQHHRPATFLPVDHEIETHADGSRTVWCGDHDPMTRMKGMHGVCLHPDRACLELKVRVYNRTPFTQTFLWWANVATRVHEDYQSFFPPDVRHVADHGRRALSTYPRCEGVYYGVDYAARSRAAALRSRRQGDARTVRRGAADRGPARSPDDLSFYANIPTPCSYMALGSEADFFGGYDHRAGAGIVHVADHRIAPGKKQWTWGHHAFGLAWDRNLTDATAEGEYPPYLELMAGVFTDNQPDFSFLQPGEVRSWSQYWYPIRAIGPAQAANVHAALSFVALGDPPRRVRLGVSVTSRRPGALLELLAGGKAVWKERRSLAPDAPRVVEVAWPRGRTASDLTWRVCDAGGPELIAYTPLSASVLASRSPPAVATEPDLPESIPGTDELFLTGLHLEQYRHATRCPTPYWREALRRDPGDARSHGALGRWHLRRGEFGLAETHLRAAIARLVRRNPNPADGEAFYHLGLCLRYQAAASPPPDASRSRADLVREAVDVLSKATWNQAWAGAAHHALAEIECARGDWEAAGRHCRQSASVGGHHPRLANLWAMITARAGRTEGARGLARMNRLIDPLDWWARDLLGEELTDDLQTRLDLAHDYARAGCFEEAIRLLGERSATRAEGTGCGGDLPTQSWGAAPLVAYTLGWLHEQAGDPTTARRHYQAGAAAVSDYCFPARLEEIAVLEAARRANPADARAPYYLGNLLYDRRRHAEAIRLWEQSARLDPGYSVVWRNLGLGYVNLRRQPGRARAAYERAFRANPKDARLLYERDQLWKRLGVAPSRRLRELERHPALVGQRDDLSVERAALLNQLGRAAEALALLGTRRFQPWEGGEGQALGQYVRTHLALGRAALTAGDAGGARVHFEAALESPRNLGEARHLLANQSDAWYWLGCALRAAGCSAEAREQWRRAATFRGDFQEMRVRSFSEQTRYSALAWERLGQRSRARKLFQALLAHARQLRRTPATLDYFATSLPTMLLFEDDLTARQVTLGWFLEAQARLGLGQLAKGRSLLREVLRLDPAHAGAADLLAETDPVRPPARSRSPRRNTQQP